jgi:hypothetical protein
MNNRSRFPGLATITASVALLLTCPSLRGETNPPPSSAPALDEAATALATSDFDLANRRFQEVAEDSAVPPFARGLAILGLAETALARKDTNAAMQHWRRLTDESALPVWQRDLAKRRMAETDRQRNGLSARDPAAYRVVLPALPAPAATYHVSQDGRDDGPGTETRPFATLAGARDAIRILRKSRGGSLAAGGVKVLVRQGAYPLNETLQLGAGDSGTAEAPIVYQAQSSGAAVLEGGRPVRGWKPVSDSAMRERLDPAVRDRVLEADLKASGISEWGAPTALKRRPELFVNGAPQTPARWPNEGFVKTGDILGQDTFKVWGSISGCKDGKFRFAEDRAKGWLDEPDVWLYGYWFWDWYEEYQQVAAIDAEAGSFTLAKPYSSYGYRKGQRYFAVNVFRELDAPGEWYLDRRSGKIYWLPPAGLAVPAAEIVLSLSPGPFISLENVHHVVLLGLTFQNGRGDGIHIKGGADCLVADCTLRRLGGDAVIIQGGRRHGVFGSCMHTLGCGGMRVDGGDRQSLAAGGHFVENCTVSDISRIKRTYAPAVHLDGCGNRVAHNLFEQIPSSAMRIEGNDHLIELNHVRQVVRESDDQGGIDMFGNPLYRGVVIRWNRWSDITGGTECGAAGIRLDDMISGTVVQGNWFERCGAVQFGGVQIHGGKENVVDGNVFVDCHAAVSFSRWDEARWLKSIESFLPQAGREPYSSRYPALANLKSDANVNFFSRNLLFGCKNGFLRDGGISKSTLMMVAGESLSPEAAVAGGPGDARLRGVLFEPIPLNEMGPYAHPWRSGFPSDAATAKP